MTQPSGPTQMKLTNDGMDVIALIVDERYRQDQKWGEQNHDDNRWLAIFTEELGEIARALLEENEEEADNEIVQAAAVLAAWQECRVRNRQKQAAKRPQPSRFVNEPLEAYEKRFMEWINDAN
jgi:NTP pyrophosphatase (non-canonical NTP hydrolase)